MERKNFWDMIFFKHPFFLPLSNKKYKEYKKEDKKKMHKNVYFSIFDHLCILGLKKCKNVEA